MHCRAVSRTPEPKSSSSSAATAKPSPQAMATPSPQAMRWFGGPGWVGVRVWWPVCRRPLPHRLLHRRTHIIPEIPNSPRDPLLGVPSSNETFEGRLFLRTKKPFGLFERL